MQSNVFSSVLFYEGMTGYTFTITFATYCIITCKKIHKKHQLRLNQRGQHAVFRARKIEWPLESGESTSIDPHVKIYNFTAKIRILCVTKKQKKRARIVRIHVMIADGVRWIFIYYVLSSGKIISILKCLVNFGIWAINKDLKLYNHFNFKYYYSFLCCLVWVVQEQS